MPDWKSVVCLISFFLSSAASGVPSEREPESLVSLERRLRDEFPSLVRDARTTLEPAQEIVAGRTVHGTRADSGLRVSYPDFYGEPFVVELGDQRVALPAIGAHFAKGTASAGNIFYISPLPSVDVIEVPGTGRGEELLLLRDVRAPRVFEYEIVEMRGIADLRIHEGAIHFAPDSTAPPAATEGIGRFSSRQPSIQIDRPWVIDATGRRSESAAHWTIVEPDDQPRRIRLTIDAATLAYPLVVDPSFSARGTMATARTTPPPACSPPRMHQ
jgi:hypothetical protein